MQSNFDPLWSCFWILKIGLKSAGFNQWTESGELCTSSALKLWTCLKPVGKPNFRAQALPNQFVQWPQCLDKSRRPIYMPSWIVVKTNQGSCVQNREKIGRKIITLSMFHGLDLRLNVGRKIVPTSGLFACISKLNFGGGVSRANIMYSLRSKL
jgi:hypothetical protein